MTDPKPCLIVECSEAESWPGLFSGIAGGSLRPEPLRLPPDRTPKMLQPDRATAEAEAQRLAQQKGGGRVFVVFEAVVAARMVKVPTHTTLSGKPTGERSVPRLLDIGEDDGIPF